MIGIGREALGADTTVGAGKYISDNVFLEVQQGVTSGSAKAKIEVELTPSLSAEIQIGQQVPAPDSTGVTTIEGQGQQLAAPHASRAWAAPSRRGVTSILT
ncbi:MAG: translocation/assembly module TamB domain-containing protein [Gammaproteobacteria bacterium]